MTTEILLLLVLAAATAAAWWWYGRLPERLTRDTSRELEPVTESQLSSAELDAEPDGASFTDELRGLTRRMLEERDSRFRPADESEPLVTPEEPRREQIFVVYLKSNRPEGISGRQLMSAVTSLGLVHGEMGVFHHLLADIPLYSLADIAEPGSFDLDEMESFSTQGLTLFMRLPGPKSGRVAFDSLMMAAHQLSQMLDCELQDRHRQQHSKESLEQLRAEATAF